MRPRNAANGLFRSPISILTPSFSLISLQFRDFGHWHAHCSKSSRRTWKVMNSTKIRKIINGSALLFAMAFGVVLVSSSSVSAQNRDWRNDQQRDDRYNNDRNRRDDRDDDNYRNNGRDRN